MGRQAGRVKGLIREVGQRSRVGIGRWRLRQPPGRIERDRGNAAALRTARLAAGKLIRHPQPLTALTTTDISQMG